MIGKMLGVPLVDILEKYLGLPCIVGRDKKMRFFKFEGSNSKSNCFLSMGGLEVFIKSILQSIPTYIMLCFLLPKSLCVDLDALIVRFWWQKSANKRGIHWCTWQSLCDLKENEGPGF